MKMLKPDESNIVPETHARAVESVNGPYSCHSPSRWSNRNIFCDSSITSMNCVMFRAALPPSPMVISNGLCNDLRARPWTSRETHVNPTMFLQSVRVSGESRHLIRLATPDIPDQPDSHLDLETSHTMGEFYPTRIKLALELCLRLCAMKERIIYWTLKQSTIRYLRPTRNHQTNCTQEDQNRRRTEEELQKNRDTPNGVCYFQVICTNSYSTSWQIFRGLELTRRAKSCV